MARNGKAMLGCRMQQTKICQSIRLINFDEVVACGLHIIDCLDERPLLITGAERAFGTKTRGHDLGSDQYFAGHRFSPFLTGELPRRLLYAWWSRSRRTCPGCRERRVRRTTGTPFV